MDEEGRMGTESNLKGWTKFRTISLQGKIIYETT